MTSRDANTWERPPQVPDTHFVSGLVYSDDEIFEQERKLIFGKVWSIACHESELPERYSFRTSDYAGTPIIITRGEDNRVRTFVNVCSHRGAKLVTERSGTTERFTCFYHLWTYDTRGACVGIPGDDAYESSGLRIEDCGLREVKTEVKLGLVFINLDDAASPLGRFRRWFRRPSIPSRQILGEKELEVFHYDSDPCSMPMLEGMRWRRPLWTWQRSAATPKVFRIALLTFAPSRNSRGSADRAPWRGDCRSRPGRRPCSP